MPDNNHSKTIDHKDDSIKVLKNILNGMDAFIYVSDPETDEILFMNDRMKKHFALEDNDGIGYICWKVLQKDFKERCSFCPIFKLNKAPGAYVEWEEHNTVSNRYYKNTDSFIDWVDGRKVHLQCSIDITQSKNDEQMLQKQIKQQELMSSISKKFISGEDINIQINNAIHLAGKFTLTDIVKFYRYNKNDQSVELLNIWTESVNASSETKTVNFKAGNELYDAFIGSDEKILVIDDVDADSRFPFAQSIGVKAFIAVPVMIADEFSGFIIFDNFSKKSWSEVDIQLAKFLSSILSASIIRINAETSLVKMSAIVENSLNYISCMNVDGNFTYVNPAMSKITGYSREELMQHGMGILNKDNAASSPRRDIVLKLSENGFHTFENVITTKSGDKRSMLMSLFFINEAKTEVGCIATDLTEQRRLEKEIIQSKETAEKASMAKGEFLARMSHEIRTPINAIMGMTTIAKNASDVEKKDYCLEKIDVASMHLLGIINDILDMSKIEANKLELVENEFNLERMIENVVSVVNFRIEQKNQNLIINISCGVPKNIIGDEMRLNQVIMNLLTNAVKFTPESGTIKLNVTNIAQEGTQIILKFEVQDTGIGISKEQQLKLFKSFEQADGSISRKFGGTGLGLAISKRIVGLMNGNISVESELGKGATFSFTIKVRKGEKQTETKINSDINLENMRILAVDDAEEIRYYFLNIMEKFSIQCDVAASGEEALALIKRNNKNPYNVIFIDWMMPKMDGIELAREIKKNDSGNCVIIMISTVKWAEIEEKAISAGVNSFIGKPLFPSAIINIINESFSGGVMLNTKNTANSMQPDKKPNYEGKCILVAEDTEINREIIKAFLQNTKVKIDFAENGIEAVEMFKAAPDKYGLILMDVQMPKMDGLEATRHIRAIGTARAKNIPIIALTANVFNEDIKECLDAGMNSHIGKPIDMNSMFVTLKKYMPEAETLSDTAKSASGGYSAFLPYINVEEGLGRIMNDKALYFRLLGSFDGKKFANDLIDNINAKDFKAAAATAHTVKGIAANLGLTALWELSKEIEAQAKAEEDLSGFVDTLTNTINKTIDLIAELTKN